MLEYPCAPLINKYARPKIVNALLTLIFRMQQGACHCCFCTDRLPMSHQWMSATNRNLHYPTCKVRYRWRSVTLIFRMGRWPCCCLFCRLKRPICRLCITATKSPFTDCTYKTKHPWCSVDAHFQNVAVTVSLSILLITAVNTLVMYNSVQITAQLCYLQDQRSLTLHWRSL